MKTLIIVCLAFRVNYALDQQFIDDFLERIQNIGAGCADETHATPDDIAELVTRQFPPSTREGRCMLFCVQREFGIMKNDGTLNRSGAMTALQPLKKADPVIYQKMLKIFIACGMKAIITPDPCDTALGLAECGQTGFDAAGLDESLLMG